MEAALLSEGNRVRRHARSLCKELLRYSLAHPNKAKGRKYVRQIRQDFKRYSQLKDLPKVEAALKKGESRLSFLKMQVPSSCVSVRRRMKALGTELGSGNGQNGNETHLSVDANGEIAVGVSRVIRNAAFSNWKDGNPDPDERRKHDSLVERFYYRGPYWEKRRQGWLPQEAVDLWKGPSLSEALIHRDKFDVALECPTSKLDNHPALEGQMLDLARRNDCVGVFDEPEIEAHKVKATEKITGEALGEGMQRMFMTQQKDRLHGAPSVTEFLRGRREK